MTDTILLIIVAIIFFIISAYKIYKYRRKKMQGNLRVGMGKL
jgi:hypothetical protein